MFRLIHTFMLGLVIIAVIAVWIINAGLNPQTPPPVSKTEQAIIVRKVSINPPTLAVRLKGETKTHIVYINESEYRYWHVGQQMLVTVHTDASGTVLVSPRGESN